MSKYRTIRKKTQVAPEWVFVIFLRILLNIFVCSEIVSFYRQNLVNKL